MGNGYGTLRVGNDRKICIRVAFESSFNLWCQRCDIVPAG